LGIGQSSSPAARHLRSRPSKRLLLSSDDEDLEQQMKHELASIVQMSRSHDGFAGVKAFKDKVEPSFTGS
jgi:hypothetical protein